GTMCHFGWWEQLEPPATHSLFWVLDVSSEVDVTLIHETLALTPQQRIQQNDRALRIIDELSDGVAKLRFGKRGTAAQAQQDPAERFITESSTGPQQDMVMNMVTKSRGSRPNQISAAEFKATCLDLMDEVDRTGAPIIVTKRGRAVAQLAPVRTRVRSG